MHNKIGSTDKSELLLYKKLVDPVGTLLTASKSLKSIEASPCSKKTPADLSNVPLINEIK